jgi:DNA-directed RNA polymerase subunit RPC12/RpoP
MKVNFKRYFLYLCRWQLSTPILAIVLVWLATLNRWTATVIANLIGGLIFFWVDRFIFRSKALSSQWEVKDNIECSDCGRLARGYRLVKTSNYDKSEDKEPKFRCEECSKKKSEQLMREGVNI